MNCCLSAQQDAPVRQAAVTALLKLYLAEEHVSPLHAFTALLAGGGVRGGQVHGATDESGGYVKDAPVSPADLSATILHHLGVDPNREYWDEFQQVARRLSEGAPLKGLG